MKGNNCVISRTSLDLVICQLFLVHVIALQSRELSFCSSHCLFLLSSVFQACCLSLYLLCVVELSVWRRQREKLTSFSVVFSLLALIFQCYFTRYHYLFTQQHKQAARREAYLLPPLTNFLEQIFISAFYSIKVLLWFCGFTTGYCPICCTNIINFNYDFKQLDFIYHVALSYQNYHIKNKNKTTRFWPLMPPENLRENFEDLQFRCDRFLKLTVKNNSKMILLLLYFFIDALFCLILFYILLNYGG